MSLFRSILISSSLLISVSHAAPLSKEVLLEKAKEIDQLIITQLEELQIERPILASDAVLLRRSFLTVIGRIPTPEEAAQFKDLGTEQARKDLILHLYEQPGYKSNMINWAMDLLRLRDRNQKGYNTKSLVHWVRDSISENKRWDELAKELVSTTGNSWVDNGAAGYYAMDLGMQNDNLSNTAFSFLGVKMECAQCHDDPFQEWERMDFYQLSALVNGETNIRFRPKGNLRKFASENPDEYQVKAFGRLDVLDRDIRYYVNFGISEQKGSGIVKLPSDWQYDDATPGELVAAKTPFGKKVKFDIPEIKELKPDFSKVHLSENKRARKVAVKKAREEYRKKKENAKHGPGNGLEVFAEWLTNDETPQFSQTIALRMWERVMGFSLTETLGVYEEAEESNFPELISYLSQLMKSYDYDLKAFQTTLALTNTFQAKASSDYYINGDPKALTGRRLNRMSSEQIWDSLLSLVVSNPDELPLRQLPTNIIFKGYNLGSIKEIVTTVQDLNAKEYAEYIKKVYRDLVAGKYPKAKSSDMYGGKGQSMEMSMVGMDEEMSKRMKKGAKKDFKATNKHLKRASELASPISKDHFLATFGQSGRITVDGSTKEGTVSQALLMYNGAVQRYIVNNKASTLRLKIESISDPTECIKTIFFTTLNRAPSPAELESCLKEVNIAGKKAYLDILSALISSQEFLFIT